MKTLSALILSLGLLLSGLPTQAQDAQSDMARLFENVNAIAQELQQSLEGLEASIQESHNSIEKGSEVLDGMLESVRKVHENIAEDSQIWKDLESLLALWEQRRQESLKKSESNPAFVPIAQAWQTRLETGRKLRSQISTQRANSLALLRTIEADREIVLAYYELGQADKAIEGLKQVSEKLANLNENMQAIVKTASEARQVPIAP
ncbi:hypothetical protein GWK36_02595 [Caldichromatium japonicum]|uniref:Uncharacterized protein n=1 Tax=Caldichromatium japonicum TaxID=2699430 RepID=A0A6G7VAS2_9GAMM|nr:hypothetical protein [Caldichromatium japonicum]QIK37074.1 hypothetical protein GWK36_02595 [Caldichromatium japonicum]